MVKLTPRSCGSYYTKPGAWIFQGMKYDASVGPFFPGRVLGSLTCVGLPRIPDI